MAGHKVRGPKSVHYKREAKRDGEMIEVKPVKIERHSGDSHGCEPYANDWPSSKEEMKTTTIIERSILEYQSSEVAMCGYDVIGFILLSKLISIVLRYKSSCLPNK